MPTSTSRTPPPSGALTLTATTNNAQYFKVVNTGAVALTGLGYVVAKSGATGDSAEAAPADLTSNTNKSFGRRFAVTGFRWLSPSDL